MPLLTRPPPWKTAQTFFSAPMPELGQPSLSLVFGITRPMGASSFALRSNREISQAFQIKAYAQFDRHLTIQCAE